MRFFLNLQQMTIVRGLSVDINFGIKELSAPAQGLCFTSLPQ